MVVLGDRDPWVQQETLDKRCIRKCNIKCIVLIIACVCIYFQFFPRADVGIPVGQSHEQHIRFDSIAIVDTSVALPQGERGTSGQPGQPGDKGTKVSTQVLSWSFSQYRPPLLFNH